MSAELRLGTRRSPLALAQSESVAAALEAAHPGLSVKLVPIETAGDRTLGDLSTAGGKGLFTADLEAALLAGALDLAVHSLKDLPAVLAPGLTIAAYPERADPRDVLVTTYPGGLEGLPRGATVLTGSLRRRAQLLLARPDLIVEPVRGNVDTRVHRWRTSGAAGMILAAAGLDRLGLREIVPAHPLDPERFVPAPGQGTLALQTPEGSAAQILCQQLDHPPTARAAAAERGVVRAFGGDCSLPLAAWARETSDGRLRITALLALPDGSRSARGEAETDDPKALATRAVARLNAAGAVDILAALERS